MGQAREKDVEEAANRDKSHYMNGDQPGVKIEDRSCTDILVCLLFVAMMVVMVASAPPGVFLVPNVDVAIGNGQS